MQFNKDSQKPQDCAVQEEVSEHAQQQAKQVAGTPEKQQKSLADEIKDDANELCAKLAENDSDEITPEQAWLYSVLSTNTLSL